MPSMTRSTSLLLFTAVLLGVLALPAHAGIVTNGSFEAGGNCRGDLGPCAGQSPWVFTPGATSSLFGVGLIGSYPNVLPGGGLRFAWFGGGTASSFDTISQILTTTPGQTYVLTFWLDTWVGHASGDFRAYWDRTLIYEDPAGSDAAHQFAWTQITVANLLGTGSNALSFQGSNLPGNDKFDLVDVQVVPEPASAILLCTGVLALIGKRRRQA